MDDENTPPITRKRTSIRLSNRKSVNAQNSSTSNKNLKSSADVTQNSTDSLPQPMLVDSSSSDRRVSLTELLNCKFLFYNCLHVYSYIFFTCDTFLTIYFACIR